MMQILSSQTTMFQARVRILLRRKIKKLDPTRKRWNLNGMGYKELEKTFNEMKYGPNPAKHLCHIAKEQANYYDMEVSDLASFMSEMAEAQEMVEQGFFPELESV